MALLGSHLTPLLAQLLASFGRHLPKSIEGFAQLLLSFGGQRLVFLPTLTHQLALLRRHGAPLRKALLRTRALLRRHRQPALAAFREGLLPVGGQTIPLVLVALQHLLLLRRQRPPSSRRCRGRRCCARRRLCRRRRRRRGRRHLREAGGSAQKTCADEHCPDHFFASCGGGAGGSFPRSGALFKNSHQAASPTSSEPRNSRNPSSGGGAGAGVDTVGDVGAGAGGVGVGGVALAAALTAQHSSQTLKPLKVNLHGGFRIRSFVRKIIKIDIVLQHLHRIS
jgi:hypothetical protein